MILVQWLMMRRTCYWRGSWQDLYSRWQLASLLGELWCSLSLSLKQWTIGWCNSCLDYIITHYIHFRGSSQLHLALLHPREVAVYLLSTEINDQGLTYMLNLVYKHSLPRTACNMTWGPFGGHNGMDSACMVNGCVLTVSTCIVCIVVH